MKKKSEEKSFFYRSTFDPLIARLYNKKKCSYCYGRGYIISDLPMEGLTSLRKNRPVRQTKSYCSCVIKNMKQQRQDEQKIKQNKPTIKEGQE